MQAQPAPAMRPLVPGPWFSNGVSAKHQVSEIYHATDIDLTHEENHNGHP
jgi:hypothetical protein